MGTRGRTSASELSVLKPTEITPRPKAPGDLSQEAAREWMSVVNRMPADWFGRETHALLAQYCRHVVASRRVADLVAAHEAGGDGDFDVETYDRLLKMQEREGRAISSLATKMRLSQQSTYDRTKRKPTQSARRPWEVDEG